MKITIVGIGYVGLPLAVLLSQHNEVVALDIVKEKVDKINRRISSIEDEEIKAFLKNKNLNLKATLDYREALKDSEFVIISTPTNYNEINNYFDTSSVEDIIKKVIETNCTATIVIKSTVPIGFINAVKKKYQISNIFFSPEFLREGKSLYDNLYPSRIIIGDTGKKAQQFADLLINISLNKNVPILFMESIEAEAVKLFSNTYLALRISFFNELDTYAELNGLNSKKIIEGVCLDPRIGNYYNNPSFGYGGYCLPKDSKQLLANYKDIPQNIIEAVVKSNDTRKQHIAKMILSKHPKKVGIYKLEMKKNSNNSRSSAIKDIIKILKKNKIDIIIFEPSIKSKKIDGIKLVNDLQCFKKMCDIIICNRIDDNLEDCKEIIYSRDIFYRD